MRNIYLFAIIFFFLLQENIFSQPITLEFQKESFHYILNLPYHTNRKIKKVFDENTPLALEIISIMVDDKILEPSIHFAIVEPSSRMDVRSVKSNKKEFNILMVWDIIIQRSGEMMLIYYFEGPSDEGYVLKKGGKELRIKYKVILPFLFMDYYRLAQRNIPKNAYSEECEVVVDLQDVFR